MARDTKYLPTGLISFYLIIGFVIMLIIEQLVAPNAHTHALDHEPIALVKSPDVHGPSAVEFDAELGDIDVTDRSSNRIAASKAGSVSISEGRERAFALLLGLVIHGAADGLALGVANLAQSDSGASNTVSFIVFLALILHKGHIFPTFVVCCLLTCRSAHFTGIYHLHPIHEFTSLGLQKIRGNLQRLYPYKRCSILFRLLYFWRRI